VIVWDRGRWTPEGDPERSLAAGKLTFGLDGEKLSGGWTLVRLGRGSPDGKANWLLIKARDEVARPSREYDVSRERPESVVSGNDLTATRMRRSRARASRHASGPVRRSEVEAEAEQGRRGAE
jgi:bifunctional non-homologous end joining protein LigD